MRVCACVRACVRECVRGYVRACVRAFVVTGLSYVFITFCLVVHVIHSWDSVCLMLAFLIITITVMEICKAPTLRHKALNEHSITHMMYIETENATIFRPSINALLRI